MSFIFKNDTRASDYADHLEGRHLVLSFMTVAELFQWAELRQWGIRRKQRLEEALRTYTVVPADIELCRYWATIRAECTKKGRLISTQDAWIAVTALRYDMSLVTHNPTDFEAVSKLQIITALT